jgi:hypothetical protein
MESWFRVSLITFGKSKKETSVLRFSKGSDALLGEIFLSTFLSSRVVNQKV